MLGQTVTQPQILLAKGLLRSSTLNPFSTSPLDSQSPLSFGILTYEVGSGRSSVAVVTRVPGEMVRRRWSSVGLVCLPPCHLQLSLPFLLLPQLSGLQIPPYT